MFGVIEALMTTIREEWGMGEGDLGENFGTDGTHLLAENVIPKLHQAPPW